MRFFGKRPPIVTEYDRWPVPISRIAPLTGEEAARAHDLLRSPRNIRRYGESDRQFPSAVCYYRVPFLDFVAERVKAHITPILGYPLLDTYWYARLYGAGDKLDIHVDREACFVSVSICLGYEYGPLFPEGSTWPIHALDESPCDSPSDESPSDESPAGAASPRTITFDLRPGEAMLYPGCSAPHWRDVFLGQACGQAFFHYVPAAPDIFGAYVGDPDRGTGRGNRKDP